MKALSRIYVALILIFLYAPVAVMILFSFNWGGSVWVFEGFSLDWYTGLATDTSMLTGLQHTLVVAVLSALISTVMGTAAAVGITALRKKLSRRIVMSVTNVPMMNADIVTGISLMLLFVFVGNLFGFKVILPSISTSIFTGAIMAFTLSLDDFVISYFTCGHYQTLPIVIYNMTKKTVTPDVYALSTLIFICVFVLLVLYNTLQSKSDSRRGLNV